MIIIYTTEDLIVWLEGRDYVSGSPIWPDRTTKGNHGLVNTTYANFNAHRRHFVFDGSSHDRQLLSINIAFLSDKYTLFHKMYKIYSVRKLENCCVFLCKA